MLQKNLLPFLIRYKQMMGNFSIIKNQSIIISKNNNNFQQSIRFMSVIQNADKPLPSSSSSSTFKIEHDVKKQKFHINFDPDNEAFIKYEHLGNNEVLLHHTEVPEQFRSTGIAKVLAMEAFKYFEENQQKMIITCTYLQKMDKKRKLEAIN
ncbi:N-acetyltransferase domain-containing protein [Euroglyphus maynei]|uniref:Protein NATD1 n=1 Tax=Euroglyphus maynei TaxID=6958 RepID=A0A1Y3BRL2_EURMA|nr:N-acetyltransferase domain-containing protein [Euroglyphus maynei]